jgi:hypothetical protein
MDTTGLAPRRACNALRKYSLLLGGLTLAFGLTATARADLLYPEPVFPTGSQPFGIVSADVNGDGVADLIAVNFKSGTVSVEIGNGDGSYKPKQDYKTGIAPAAVAAADLDGDGSVDLVTDNRAANGNPGSVNVLLNKGDGTFSAPKDYSAANSVDPVAVALEDFNEDGHTDIAVADLHNAQVVTLQNTGNGTFKNGNFVQTGKAPDNVIAADVNGDKHIDLVTTNSGADSISVAFGQGNGKFQAAKSYMTSAEPDALALADINGDGVLDALVGSGKNAVVSVLLGDGNGGFTTKTDYATDDTHGAGVSAVGAADLNGDGGSDIVVANGNANTLSVLLNQSKGSSFASHKDYPTERAPVGLVAGKLNADGDPDVAVVNRADNGITVLLGNGDGTFQTKNDYATAHEPAAVLIADLDGDGNPDVATASSGTPSAPETTVSVLKGDGKGRFGKHVDYTTGKTPDSIATADLNGDHTPDLVTADSQANQVSVLLGASDGSFPTHQEYSVGQIPVMAVTTDAKGDAIDLDNDNMSDIVVVNEHSNNLSVLLGNGQGSFTKTNSDYATGTDPVAVAVGDVNGDGTLDAVTANFGGKSFSVLLGDGHGNFSSHKDVSLPSGARSVALADLNGDNKLDVAVTIDPTSTAPAGLQIYTGNGDGAFTKGSFQATGAGPRSLHLVDVNGDHKLDAVVANSLNAPTLSVLIGNGDGTFSAKTDYLAGIDVDAVAVADIDGDSKPDLVSANFGADNISVLLQATVKGGAGNHAPKAANVALTTTAGAAKSGQLKATDQDRDTLTYSIVKKPGHGTVKITDANKGTFTYTPSSGFTGTDSFTYKANDGSLDSNTATVTVTVQSKGGGNGGGGGGGGHHGGGGAFGLLGLLLGSGLLLGRVLPERRRS